MYYKLREDECDEVENLCSKARPQRHPGGFAYLDLQFENPGLSDSREGDFLFRPTATIEDEAPAAWVGTGI